MPPTSSPQIDGHGRRILVVDDDLAIRVLLQAVLRRMNFEVDLAENGEIGMEKLETNGGYDLVLLDLMMPKMNGYQFIERAGEIFGKSRPHIVVFTAAGQRGVDKISPGTVCSSILKPFDLDKFLDLVADCMTETHRPNRHSS